MWKVSVFQFGAEISPKFFLRNLCGLCAFFLVAVARYCCVFVGSPSVRHARSFCCGAVVSPLTSDPSAPWRPSYASAGMLHKKAFPACSPLPSCFHMRPGVARSGGREGGDWNGQSKGVVAIGRGKA